MLFGLEARSGGASRGGDGAGPASGLRFENQRTVRTPGRETGKRERAVGKTVILVTAKQQTGNALHTHATEHGFEPRSRLACRGVVAFVILGCLPNQPNGGCRLIGLSKRAKKHSIAADCSELKATFGPCLRGTAKQKVKH